MGWMFYSRPKGESNREHFQRQFGEGYAIIDSATVGGTFYGAIRDPQGNVSAAVILTRWVPNDEYNFGYKDMSEDMGPNEANCPGRILDLLTPTESEYANEWRARCRANLAKRAEAAKVKRGDLVKFERPITFTNGFVSDTFEFVERNTFRVWSSRFRITGWRDMNFEVQA